MTTKQMRQFFKDLAKLPPQKQAKKVRAAISRYPALTRTKAFLNWGVKFALVLK